MCRLGYILDRLPNARVIVIVRDGRDVFLSLRERLSESSRSYLDDDEIVVHTGNGGRIS